MHLRLLLAALALSVTSSALADDAPTAAEATRAIRASLGGLEVRDLDCSPRSSGFYHLCAFSPGPGRPAWTAVFVQDEGKWRLHHTPWPAGVSYLPINIDGYMPGGLVSVERCLTRGGLEVAADGRVLCVTGLSLPVGPAPP